MGLQISEFLATVLPLSVLQYTLNTCVELEIPIVAYSLLGRGFLTHQTIKLGELDPNDHRHHLPRF